jgi:hypothetical protein
MLVPYRRAIGVEWCFIRISRLAFSEMNDELSTMRRPCCQ